MFFLFLFNVFVVVNSSSKPREDAMDEGGEPPPQVPDDQQTTSEEGSGSAVDRQTDTPEDVSDLSGDPQDDVEIFGDLHEDFADAIEPFFVKAVKLIERGRFDLDSAKNLVLTVRDLGQRHVTRGCTEMDMEDIVVNRALRTVFQLVDGVNLVSKQRWCQHGK